MDRYSDTRGYEILYDLREGEMNCTEVGAMRTRTNRAGDSLEIEACPLTRVGAQARAEAKRRKSTPQQQELNIKRTKKRIRRLAEANFDESCILLTVTYDYGQIDRFRGSYSDTLKAWEDCRLPFEDADVKRDVDNFFRRLRRLMIKMGLDPKLLKYLWVIESTKEHPEDPNPMPVRYHVHMLLDAPGLSREMIEATWGKGYANCKRLDLSKNGLEALCNYITKQRRFMHRWGKSKNLKEPEEHVSDRKISRRRAALIARDVQYRGREILEQIYPGYRVESYEVKFSDFVAGAYIYARLRKMK